MRDFIRICDKAAKAGGEVLRKLHDKIQAREKGPSDLVTEADLAAQQTIRKIILDAFPTHDFLGEEELDAVSPTNSGSEFTWIVDPLDGTTNYVHGLDHFCVSVALQRDKELIVGAIYDPSRDLCYSASKGNGAFVNGTPIKVSNIERVKQALIAVSLPPVVEPGSTEIDRFLRTMFASQALRRMGSAALNLCYVATGQLDGYWATSVKKWDVAAGFVIVREAGGTITSIDGGTVDLDDPKFIAAGQIALGQEMVELLQ